jgi:hypothetical protein
MKLGRAAQPLAVYSKEQLRRTGEGTELKFGDKARRNSEAPQAATKVGGYEEMRKR